MRLQTAHPVTAGRTCDECIRWMWNTETGRLVCDRVTGLPVSRPPASRPPCHSCPKCQIEAFTEASPETGRRSDLSGRNKKTLALYYQQLVAPQPVDDIMRTNFGIIHQVLTEFDRLTMRFILERPRL